MRALLDKLPDKMSKYEELTDKANEITLRCGRRAVIKVQNRYIFTDYVTTAEDIQETFIKMCDMSVYAYQDEVKNGFITLKGGHRVGVCGTAVMRNNEIHNIKNLNSLNVRIAREHLNCADKLGFEIKNLMIISPPGCGKTTILRDISRKLGAKYKVGIIDERGEIAGVHKGLPCFDVGLMTDVLSLCDKTVGIEMMLRSMSPEYLIVDEIANKDVSSLNKALTCGVKIIASAHGDDIEKTIGRLGLAKEVFDNIVLLGDSNGIGTIEKLFGGANNV